MKPAGRARLAGLVLGAFVMCGGVVLSLELGAWGHSLVAATLSAVMDHRSQPATSAQLEVLLDELRHAPNPARRIDAARRLSRSHVQRAVAGLKAALTGPDSRVQLAVVLALGDIADPSTEADLRQVLTTSADARVRQAAASGLAVIQYRSRSRSPNGASPFPAQLRPTIEH